MEYWKKIITLSVILIYKNVSTVNGQPPVRSHVNFGTALIPEDILVNSGSIWHHTFQIKNIFEDPVPPRLKEESNLTYNECQTNTASAIELVKLDKVISNSTLKQFKQVTNDTCQRILEIAKAFNEQKDILIREIDENIETIKHLAYPETDFRGNSARRYKRAPLEFFSVIGEKVFGTARKKNLKILEEQQKLLAQATQQKFNFLAANMKMLFSANKIQNYALGNITEELSDQQRQMNDIVSVFNRTQMEANMLFTDHSLQLSFLYYVLVKQNAIQTQIVKSTMTVLNTLTLMRVQTGEIRNALQKVASGQLPNELIPSHILEDTLQQIDRQLMQKRSTFRLAINSLQYYYGINIASFGHNKTLYLQIRVPLTTAGATFQNFKIKTFQIPVPVQQGREVMKHRYSQIVPEYPYFAISMDEEYYIELDEQDLAMCKGLEGSPHVCNPVKFMYSVRTRPSCGLALYTGNSTMMKYYCKKEYEEADYPRTQIQQIGSTANLLITAVDKQFIKHCDNGVQMISIPACELCVIKLPCGCLLRSSEGMLPAIHDECSKEYNATQDVRYPVNLLVLSRILRDTELEHYNGSVTFNTQPEYALPYFELEEIQSDKIVAAQKAKSDLDQISELAQVGSDIFATAEAFINNPVTILEKIVKTPYAGLAQIIITLMNAASFILAAISYKKGCSSAITAAMALKVAKKGALASPLPPQLPNIPIHLNENEAIHNILSEFWQFSKTYFYMVAVILSLYLLLSAYKTLYKILVLRQCITPCDPMFKEDTTNVYLIVTNGKCSVNLYLYTIQACADTIKLIQFEESKLKFCKCPNWPTRILAYVFYITSSVCLLELSSGGQCIRLPEGVFVPITLAYKLRTILNGEYNCHLYVGNNIYHKLEPNYVSITSSRDYRAKIRCVEERLKAVRDSVHELQFDSQQEVPAAPPIYTAVDPEEQQHGQASTSF